MAAPVTAVIKAKNEAHQIGAAVSSAFRLASRVIVVDDCSEDSTASIARSAGADVLKGRSHHGVIDRLDAQGFLAVETGWILRMDADERVTVELADALREVIADAGGRYAGVRYARLNFMFGEEVRYGGWLRPQQLGLFKAEAWDREWNAELHSQVPIRGAVYTVPPEQGFMLHLDYENVHQFIERSLKGYAAVEAREMHSRGIAFRRRRLLLGPLARMWGRYIFRQGWRDGDRGLVLASLLSAYDVCRYAMLWDLERQSGDHDARS